jgi:succinyl-CoA synthetase alpha subunit
MQAFSRCARPVLQAAVRRQGYATSTSAYAATGDNLRINKDTKVIYQGFTGKQGT